MSRSAGLVLIAFGVVLGAAGFGLVVMATGRPALDTPVFIGGLASGAAALGCFVAAAVVLRRPRRTRGEAGAGTGDYLPGAPEDREVDGVGYEVLFTPAVKKGKHSTPSSLKVSVPAPSPADVRFGRRTGFDNFGRSVGLARPVPTDDPEFDATVATRASHDAYADLVAADPAARRAVLDLLAAKFDAVRLTGSHAEAERTGFDPAKHDRPGLTDGAAVALAAVAAARPDPDGLDLSPRAKPHVPLWVMLAGSAVLIAAVPFYPPVRTSGLLALAAVVFAAAYPLFALAAGVMVRGTTVGHDRWISLALAAVPLLGLACAGGVAGANGALDPGPETVRSCPVVDRTTHKTKNGRNYRVVVRDWADPGRTLSYSVSEGEYNAVVPGRSRVVVTTRPGGLGVEWQVGRRLER